MLALQGRVLALTFSSVHPLGVSKETPAHSRLGVYMEKYPDDQGWGDRESQPAYALHIASPVRGSPEDFPDELLGKSHLASSLHLRAPW